MTPDIHAPCSKRAFDGRVRAWRRALHQWDPVKADGEVDIFDDVGAVGDLDGGGGDADAAAGIEPPPPLPLAKAAATAAAAAAADMDDEAALLGDDGGGGDGAVDADTGALSAYDEAELQAMLAELG